MEQISMQELSRQLLSHVEISEPVLRRISDQESLQPALPGGWSRKQLIGHLIDSASNNHQRFVHASLQDSLEFPGYDQAGNVRVQFLQEVDWSLLITLWASYNRYVAHILAHLSPSKLETPCRIGTGEPVTLAYIATDYLAHLVHHLNQIGLGGEASSKL